MRQAIDSPEIRSGGRAPRGPRAGRALLLALVVGSFPLASLLAGDGLEIEGGDRTMVSNGIVFTRDIYEPVLKPTCAQARCHDLETREHDLSMLSWEDIASGSEDGPIFIPGKADESEIMLRLRGKKKPPMPLKKKALPGETQQRIADWIDSGVIQLTATLGGQATGVQWSVQPDSFGLISGSGLFTPNVEEGEGLVVATKKSATDTIRITVLREAP